MSSVPFSFCVTRSPDTEVVILQGPLPSTVKGFVATLSGALRHVAIHHGDMMWVHDAEFDCDVILTQMTQLSAAASRSFRVNVTPMARDDDDVRTTRKQTFASPMTNDTTTHDRLRVFLVKHG